VSLRRLLPLTILVAGLVLAFVFVFRQSRVEPAPAPAPAPPPQEAATEEPVPASELTPLPRQSVMIYYPALEWNGLIGEEHEIFGTASPGDRAKQILSDLLAGPTGELTRRALPPGTQLLQVYVLDSGVAYVDFSADLKRGIGGGSSEELLTVYAIVDSVALNVAEIKRVGILVNGSPIETLSGHVDLRRPLSPDRAYIVDEAKGDETIVVRGGNARERAN
jgi:spore germination protein GerM